jgi:hypothetical protein
LAEFTGSKIRTFLLLALLFRALSVSFSQPSDSLAPSRIDTTFISEYHHFLTARFYFLYQDVTFEINQENLGTVIYKPNLFVKAGIAGYYKWFGLSLSVNVPFFLLNETEYGKTTSLDTRINVFGRSISGELVYQDYKGYYIQNFHTETGHHYKIPDMRILAIGISSYWIYNSERFSLRAAFIQNERQKKSAGSFMVRPSFQYFKVSSDSGIIPREVFTQAGEEYFNVVNEGEFFSFGLAPGYSYTFIFAKKFYINAAVFPGVFWESVSYSTERSTVHTTDFSFLLTGQLGVGYNSDRFHAGIMYASGISDIPVVLGKSQFYYNGGQVRLWVGTRFDWFRKKKN